MTKPTNTPKLRFPEFSEEWENKSITDDFSIIDGDRGKHYPSSKDLLKKGDCIFLSAENITKKGWSFKNLKFITRKKDISMGKGKLKLNDLILTTRGTVGNVVRYHEEIPFQDMRINSGMVILRTIQPSQFFLTLFTSNFMKRFLNKVTVQSAQPHLTVATIKMMKFFIPKSIKEQEKIGTFFSKLDRQIELEEKKLELLEQQKRGYMQKIFSQQLRFKDENGNDYPDWEDTKLNSIADIKTGNKNAQDSIENGKYMFFDRSVDIKYLNTFDFDEEAIIYPGEGSKFLPRYFKGKYSLHQRAYSIHNIKIDPQYLYNYLELQNNHFLKYAVGSTVKSLRMIAFNKLIISTPFMDEQEKIGNFFNKIDNLIELQTNKIESLKQRKKGLLQKMFV